MDLEIAHLESITLMDNKIHVHGNILCINIILSD